VSFAGVAALVGGASGPIGYGPMPGAPGALIPGVYLGASVYAAHSHCYLLRPRMACLAWRSSRRSASPHSSAAHALVYCAVHSGHSYIGLLLAVLFAVSCEAGHDVAGPARLAPVGVGHASTTVHLILRCFSMTVCAMRARRRSDHVILLPVRRDITHLPSLVLRANTVTSR